VSILGVAEAFRIASIDASANFVYTPLVAAALLYICVTIPLARLFDRLESRRTRARAVEAVTA
jgi:polar amino acid transport system permease protein